MTRRNLAKVFNDTAQTSCFANLQAETDKLRLATPAEMKEMYDLIALAPQGQKLIELLEAVPVPSYFSADTLGAYTTTRIMGIDDGHFSVGLANFMSAFKTPEANASSLLHEARHIEQCSEGLIFPKQVIPPEDYCWLTRMYEADAAATEIELAYKIKLQGNSGLFNHAACLSPSLCDAFERAVTADPANLDNGTAKRAAFDAWFKYYKKQYDGNVITALYPAFLEALSQNPDHGLKPGRLGVADVEKLGGLQGNGLNYLTLPGFKPLDDPYYREGFSAEHQKKLAAFNGLFS